MIQRKLNLGKVPISEIFYINEQFKQHTLLSEFKQHSWSYPSFYSSYLQVSPHSYLCLSTIIIWLFNSLFIINLSRTISRIFEFFYIILFILQKKKLNLITLRYTYVFCGGWGTEDCPYWFWILSTMFCSE